MKKLLLTLSALLLFTSYLVAQVSDDNTVLFHFFKVEDGKQAEYETVMKDYYGEIMKENIKNGCMQNWIFRRVLPGTNASNYFTHVTVDVLNPGKTNYQCEEVTKETGIIFKDAGWIGRNDYHGHSPDGISLCEKIGLEIKCPSAKVHNSYVRDNKIPLEYVWQIVNFFAMDESIERLYFAS